MGQSQMLWGLIMFNPGNPWGKGGGGVVVPGGRGGVLSQDCGWTWVQTRTAFISREGDWRRYLEELDRANQAEKNPLF